MAESYPQLLISHFGLINRETKTPLFDDLNFILPAGKIMGLYGPSGAGKSLFCRALVGLLPGQFTFSGGLKIKLTPTDVLVFDSLEAANWSELRKKYVSIIFQDPLKYLNPVITIGQQIQEMAENKSLENAWDVLGNLGFSNPQSIWLKYPHQLSGGQLQRVHLAIALLKHTPFLIADEITTALDVLTERQIMQYLRTLAGEHRLAVLFITHNKRLMDEFADGQVALTMPNDQQSNLVKMKHNGNKSPREELLKITGLSINYHAFNAIGNKENTIHAVDEISFSLSSGEILGLVGETGSGKSSIGRSIAGLVEFEKGTIIIKGQSLNKINRKKRASLVQIVFQDSLAALTPHLTIRDLLLEVATGTTKMQEIADLLSMVGLSKECLDRYPIQLSGGQRQRVSFVRALLNHPELLICDESIASLDENTQHAIVKLLVDLKLMKDLAIIFITHDIGWAASLSDKLMVIKDGKMLDYGSEEELLANSKNSYTHALLSKR